MENTTPPPNAQSVYSPYFSSEKELLKDVAKAETRIDNHDKEIEALKTKCGQLGEEISKLKEWRAYMMGGIGVCMFLGPLVLKWMKIL